MDTDADFGFSDEVLLFLFFNKPRDLLGMLVLAAQNSILKTVAAACPASLQNPTYYFVNKMKICLKNNFHIQMILELYSCCLQEDKTYMRGKHHLVFGILLYAFQVV